MSKPQARALTPHVPIRKVEAVVNAASGHVGPHAAEALEQLLGEFGLSVRIANAQPHEIPHAVKAAMAAKPDLVVILAGDGTARFAAQLAGGHGPLIAPLPGGTMNMLPHAVYGQRSWRDALIVALSEGVPRSVSGGEVGGAHFYVAAMLGSPALFADAREAVRERRFWLAVRRSRRAFSRLFSGRLRVSLDSGEVHKVEALTLMCPLVSRALNDDEGGLEAVEIDPKDVLEALRLGTRTLLTGLLGDWRQDPAVNTELCKHGRVGMRGGVIPALLDGEPHRLRSPAQIRFLPRAMRVLAPPSEHHPTVA